MKELKELKWEILALVACLIAIISLFIGTKVYAADSVDQLPHRINTSMEFYKEQKDLDSDFEESLHWQSIGERRITEYCPVCNSPHNSYESSSGVKLEEGMAACNWLSNGTRIMIDGEEYIITDYCGTDAIDIFRDTDECLCDINEYKEVWVYDER